MKELKGQTMKDRQNECPPGYWCCKPGEWISMPEVFSKEEWQKTEIWYDPHGMICPVCREDAVDAQPPTFMCMTCGVCFEIDICNQNWQGKKVALM